MCRSRTVTCAEMFLRILLVATFFQSSSGHAFFLVSPRYIKPGIVLKLFVDASLVDTYLKDWQAVNATATLLENEVRPIVSRTTQVSAGKLRATIKLQVPPSLNDSAYSVEYSFKDEDGNQFAKPILSSLRDMKRTDSSLHAIVQTDKGIYKAGQTGILVNYIKKDGDRNRVRRWENVSDSSGVYVGRVDMSNFPVLGEWSLKVTGANVDSTSISFEVKEFELPKFEVTIDVPRTFAMSGKAYLEGSVKALYTFGKGVSGKMEVFIGKTRLSTLQMEDGVAEFKISLLTIAWSALYSTATIPSLNYRKVTLKAVVTEDLTGNVMETVHTVTFYTYPVELKKAGNFPYRYIPNRKLRATYVLKTRSGDPVDAAMRSQYSVIVRCSNSANSTLIKRPASIDSTNNINIDFEEQDLLANYYSVYCRVLLLTDKLRAVDNEYFRIYRFDSEAGFYLHIQRQQANNPVNVGDTVSFVVRVSNATANSIKQRDAVTVTYEFVSRNLIVLGPRSMKLPTSGSMTINVKVTTKMSPSFVLVVWTVVPNKGIDAASDVVVAYNMQVPVIGQSKSKDVSIKFGRDQVEPGDDVTVNINTEPRSSVYVLAVDTSILLLNKGNDVTEDMLPAAQLDDPMNKITLPYNMEKIIEDATLSVDLSYLQEFVTTSSTTSSMNTFPPTSTGFPTQMRTSQAGTTTLPVMAGTSPVTSTVAAATESGTTRESVPVVKKETVRKLFPDTWLFSNVTSGTDGLAELRTTAPDTITSWVANCFAVSPTSELMVAKRPAKLEVFLTFFVSVQLPSSVIRGEQLVIQAIVFNYYKEDLYVVVTLKRSRTFRSLVMSKGKMTEKYASVSKCILAKAGKGTSAFFPIIANTLGEARIVIKADSRRFKDKVKKKLLVKPEGLPQSVAHPVMVDLTSRTTFTAQMEFQFPPQTVQGSQRIEFTATGDLMGSTIDGLDRLVRMPYGCGEQNILSMAPSVFVTKYLTAVGTMSANLRNKANRYMTTGIQRQLRYMHGNGAFSAWGRGQGSTWLTAFVVRVFAMATPFVYVEDDIINKGVSFLLSKQASDGRFEEHGTVIHRAMQGGVSSGEKMTAYVLIALLEAQSTNISMCDSCRKNLKTGISRAVGYLSANINNETSVYTVALTAYALTLAHVPEAGIVRDHLQSGANQTNDEMFWDVTSSSNIQNGRQSVTALDVETTAYALLTYAGMKEISKGLKVVRWLVGQRNPYGGFKSTQDTVIGLQSLAEFASLTSKSSSLSIIMSYRDTRLRKRRIRVRDSNRMILQKKYVSRSVPGNSYPTSLRLHAYGTKGSTALFTVSLFYNVYSTAETKSLNLNISVVSETVNGFTVRSCISWLDQDESGMLVVEVGIPSGFEPNLYTISSHESLMKSELGEDAIALYYEKVTGEPVCTNISMQRNNLVADVKQVPCKAYEYYEPSNEATVFYTPTSMRDSNICKICGKECGCSDGGQLPWFPKAWCRRRVKVPF